MAPRPGYLVPTARRWFGSGRDSVVSGTLVTIHGPTAASPLRALDGHGDRSLCTYRDILLFVPARSRTPCLSLPISSQPCGYAFGQWCRQNDPQDRSPAHHRGCIVARPLPDGFSHSCDLGTTILCASPNPYSITAQARDTAHLSPLDENGPVLHFRGAVSPSPLFLSTSPLLSFHHLTLKPPSTKHNAVLHTPRCTPQRIRRTPSQSRKPSKVLFPVQYRRQLSDPGRAEGKTQPSPLRPRVSTSPPKSILKRRSVDSDHVNAEEPELEEESDSEDDVSEDAQSTVDSNLERRAQLVFCRTRGFIRIPLCPPPPPVLPLELFHRSDYDVHGQDDDDVGRVRFVVPDVQERLICS
ncbi:hypothetical protein C8F01DRAFT_666733 [Mycena amicta]|nr:hypothetical protein C8F01DRAFT_666733 [Mycena amicta]